MEFSSLFNPSFLLTAGLVIIGFIVWLVRLEGKVSNTAAINEQQQKTIDKLSTEVEHHRFNDKIHFNERIAGEVDKGNERRFTGIERRLDEISGKLDTIAAKQ